MLAYGSPFPSQNIVLAYTFDIPQNAAPADIYNGEPNLSATTEAVLGTGEFTLILTHAQLRGPNFPLEMFINIPWKHHLRSVMWLHNAGGNKLMEIPALLLAIEDWYVLEKPIPTPPRSKVPTAKWHDPPGVGFPPGQYCLALKGYEMRAIL
jgi:hypothetical protein